jgi:type IV secretory pathway ATPase VirB11/archaellum biosynthesis ATPase
MHCAEPGASVAWLAKSASAHFDSSVTNACINRPREMFVENGDGWRRLVDNDLTLQWAEALVIAAATAEGKDVGPHAPFLSASLPYDIRLHAVMPPACKPGRVILTFRRAVAAVPELEHLKPLARASDRQIHGKSSASAKRASRLTEALKFAIASKSNIAIIGDTGSGKTTVLRSLLLALGPDERVITLEDTDEIRCQQANAAALFFGASTGVSASQCVSEVLRMRPDRIIIGELRGIEAYDYLKALSSGHRGSITSFHAISAALATRRLALLAKGHPETRQMTDASLVELVAEHLDCVIHVDRIEGRYGVRDMVWLRRANA